MLLHRENMYFENQSNFIYKVLNDAQKQTVIAADNVAVWEETVKFVRGENPDFLEKNWPNTTPLAYLGLHFLVIKDASGKDVHTEFYDVAKKVSKQAHRGFSEAISELAAQAAAPRRADGVQDLDFIGKTGAFVYGNTLYLMTVMPILENYDQVRPDGTVTIGYILDLKNLNRMMDEKIIHFSIKKMDSPAHNEISIDPYNRERVSLRISLPYILEKDHSLELTVHMSRFLYIQGISFLQDAGKYVCIAIIILAILSYLMTMKYYILPIEQLNREIETLDSGSGIETGGNTLARDFVKLRLSINEMLERLKKSDSTISILQSIVSGSGIHIFISDEDTNEIIFINETMMHDLGLTPPVRKKCWQVLYPDQPGACVSCPLAALDEPGKTVTWDEHSPETQRSYRNMGSLITWFDGRRVRLHHRVDTTEAKKTEVLLQQARRDALTGLGNRTAYLERLNELSGFPKRSLGVIFIDLNDLKYINDKYGHQAGDNYICSLSRIFYRHFRETDIFRIGGDEFVILCDNMSEALFHRKIAELSAHCEQYAPGSIAFGAVWNHMAANSERMIREADEIMYAEKRRQKAMRGSRPAIEPPFVSETRT